MGEDTVEVRAGQIVLVPAGMAHTFINSGEGLLRQTSIHPSPHMIEERIER
jgi:mannose-6-phosphate isomerase-like protein (cupin superfamily)